jgi:hypothetical protein
VPVERPEVARRRESTDIELFGRRAVHGLLRE